MIKDESLKHQSYAVSKNCGFESEDNLSEVLSYIINFAHARQKILIRNLNCADNPGFVPHDMPVAEFAKLLNAALNEHVSNNRLMLCDTDNIKFRKNGAFDMTSVPDLEAEKILRKNKNLYIELQTNKLLENTLNQKLAAETLKQKQLVKK